MDDELQLIETYAILLVGVLDRPIPTKTHFQKEMFILTQSSPDLQEYFQFQEYHFGPYSQVLEEIVEDPLYYEDAIINGKNGFYLSPEGKKIYNKLVSEINSENERELLIGMKLIRQIYDKLTYKELILLVYEAFPNFTDLSDIKEDIVTNPVQRKLIIKGLFEKGLITENKFRELMVNNAKS